MLMKGSFIFLEGTARRSEKCNRKPCGTDQQFKTSSVWYCNVTTTFEQVRGNKHISEGRDYVKKYRKAGAIVLGLCEKVDVLGSS